MGRRKRSLVGRSNRLGPQLVSIPGVTPAPAERRAAPPVRDPEGPAPDAEAPPASESDVAAAQDTGASDAAAPDAAAPDAAALDAAALDAAAPDAAAPDASAAPASDASPPEEPAVETDDAPDAEGPATHPPTEASEASSPAKKPGAGGRRPRHWGPTPPRPPMRFAAPREMLRGFQKRRHAKQGPLLTPDELRWVVVLSSLATGMLMVGTIGLLAVMTFVL